MTLIDTIARSSIPAIAARIGRTRGLSPIAVSLLGFAAYKIFEHFYNQQRTPARAPARVSVRRALPSAKRRSSSKR